MATFMDMFNQAGQKLGQGLDNPWTQLGMQLMQAGGPQQVDVSGGQRLTQALSGFGEMQAATVARQRAQAELQRQQQMNQAVREAVMANPNMLPNNPLAQAVLAGGGTLADLKGVDKFAVGTGSDGMAKRPWQQSRRNANGSVTEFFWDQNQGGWTEGATYMPADVQNAATARGNLEVAQGGLEVRRAAETRQSRLGEEAADRAFEESQRRQQKQEREMAGAYLKSKMDHAAFKGTYAGARNRFDRLIKLATEVRDHKGLEANYGKYGYIPNVAGSEASDAWAKVEELTANLGLSELQALAKAGVVLTPVSNTDLDVVTRSAANPTKFQSYKQAKETYDRVVKTFERARDEAAGIYTELDNIYSNNPPAPPPGTGLPVRPGSADAPQGLAQPQSQADFDALPAGSLYIDPDDGRTYRK